MRLAILCGRSTRAAYVANTLCACHPVICIVREVGHEYSWRKLRAHLRPATLRAKLYRHIRPWLFPPDLDERRFFFPERPATFHDPQRVHAVGHINAPGVVELLQRLRIDTIAVFGTSVLRNPALLGLAPGRTLNLHGGISPWYRGADSTFWALYNRDFDRIGCTIHHIARRIDAGHLIAHVHPPIEPGDRESHLFAKAIKLAAPVYAQALARLSAGEPLGIPQPPGGRLYLQRERHYRHDRELWRRYRAGGFPGIRRPSQVVWYPAQATIPAAPDAALAATGP
jgi:methionyl-tRNA formyltransferase